MVPVLLLGDLGEKFGRRFTLDIKSPAEAVRALVANFPELQQYMSDRYYRVVVGKADTGGSELHNPTGQQLIKIVPVIVGAGGALGSIFMGAALIGLAFATGGASLAATGLFGFGMGLTTTFLGGIALSMGASMILGGVAQMLAPSPQSGAPSEPAENNPSYLFNGPINTTQQGQPVAVGYGRLRVGSAVISAGLVAEQVAV